MIKPTCPECGRDVHPYPAATRGIRRCHSCAAKESWRKGEHAHITGRALSRLQILGRPCTVRDMSDAEAAWVGAMIEGEGNFVHQPAGKNGRLSHGAEVLVHNTEVETVATCLRLVGDGTINVVLPRAHRMATMPLWRWRTAKHRSMRKLLPQIIPFLTGKREAACLYLSLLEHETELLDAADIVYEVANGGVKLIKSRMEERE